MPKSQIPKFLGPPHFLHFRPRKFLDFRSKIKSLMKIMLCLLKGFQMVWHDHIAPKLTNQFGSLEMGHCQTRYLVERPLETAHLPNQSLVFIKPWKFQFASCIVTKVIHFLLWERHTFCIPIWTGKIFVSIEIFLHYVPSFDLFSHSPCL